MISNEILNQDSMLEVEFDAVFPYTYKDYEKLDNKPSINGVTLEGDKTTEELKIELPDMDSFVKKDTNDLENYYNKTVTDEKLEGKADVSAIPDVSDFTTPTDVGEMLDEFSISFEQEMNDKLNEKANVSDIPDVSKFITKDVDNLTNYELKTNTGNNIALSVDPATFVMTITLKNSADEVLSTGTVDLPLETMVVNASYDNTTKEIILSLQNGNVIRFSVADLVSGLAKSDEVYTKTEIDNKGFLTSETDPTVPTHVKNITQENITSWNNKSDFSGSYNDLTDKPADYVLPTASADTLGGIKVGDGLSIDADGILSALGGSGSQITEIDTDFQTVGAEPGMYRIAPNKRILYNSNSIGFYGSTLLILWKVNTSTRRLAIIFGDGYYPDDASLRIYFLDTANGAKPYDIVSTADVLTRSNKGIYTPSGDYNPATKKYVDDAIAAAIANLNSGS